MSDEIRSHRLCEPDRSGQTRDDVNRNRLVEVQRLFSGAFKKKDLLESLEKAVISTPNNVAEECETFAEQWSPVQNEERIKKISFVSAYTWDFSDGNKEENPYRVLNGAMQFFREKRTRLLNIRWFLYGLLEGLRSLPYMQYKSLYRGIDVGVSWEVDDLRTFATFTSMTREKSKAEAFLKHGSGGKLSGTLITATGLFGYDISGYSLFGQKEKEVILEPFQRVNVRGIEKKDDVVNVELVDGGGSEFLIEGKIPRNYVIKSPESDLLQGALDHCRAADELKDSGKMSEAEKEWEEGMGLYLEASKEKSKIGSMNVGVGMMLGIGITQEIEKGLSLLKTVGEVCDDEIWMIRELSNREFFIHDGIDLSGLLIIQ